MTINKKTPISDRSISFLENLTGKKVTIGHLLWSIRESEAMTQVEFAKKLAVSRQYLCDLEHNRRIVSAKAASDFASRLGYSPIHFIQIAMQDELNKYGFNLEVQIIEHKDAA
ncbi:MAG: helix-turn-helix transcriptional regulator [Legionella sp.]|nr:helix-turn-helix transcriptional regulator [Legionella sp.]